MKLRFVCVAYLLFLLCPGLSMAGTKAFPYATDLGVAIENSGQVCLAIDKPGLSEGAWLQLVVMTTPQAIAEAKVAGIASSGCGGVHLEDPDSKYYLLRLVQGELPQNTPAIAVTNSMGPLSLKRSYVSGDLDGNGHREFFRACTSQEGVHLTVWSGKALRGKLRWHRYYSLGYDVQPNCTMQETSNP